MCLISQKNLKPLKTQYAWKILEYDPHSKVWQTPYRGMIVTNNKLKAKGRKKIVDYKELIELSGGAIHCFRNKNVARKRLDCYYRFLNNRCMMDVFKVKGKGYILHNLTEIAFKEIEFLDNVNDYYIETS